MARFRFVDWLLILAIIPLLILGLLTMKSLGGDDYYFNRQLVWVIVSFAVMFSLVYFDWRSLKSSAIILLLYLGGICILALVSILGYVARGAKSWILLGPIVVEPVEIMKIIIILLLAKYFSRRHIEIVLWRHIVISFFYIAVPVIFVILQPDFGSAVILLFVWAAMLLFSGLSMRQILYLFTVSIILFTIAWGALLAPYQKERIITFLQPERDQLGSGYHAIQAMIAVGSGGIWGKGVGYGTQSRLNFLPESETDFIFAAFAEEWGLVGVIFIFICMSIIFWRIIRIVIRAPDNFAKLYGLGVSFLLIGHIIIHVGMNVGLLPITGIGFPFMSYGGSFLVLIMASIGLLESIEVRFSALKAFQDEDYTAVGP